MTVDVAFLPSEIDQAAIGGQTVVVLDVLRATTTMTAVLAAGIREIRVFEDVESAKSAAQGEKKDRPLLCGEVDCLPPAGFDLGNSPGALDQSHLGKRLFMSTTNGTRAIIAGRGAGRLFIGALVNAQAVAMKAFEEERDLTLVCAGTNGQVAMEDVIGAGAIIDAIRGIAPRSDKALMAHQLFKSAGRNLHSILCETRGGMNVLRARLMEDIDFAAQLDCFDVVGRSKG